MRFRVSQEWLYDFAYKLLREADVSSDAIDADLENFVYEAGERGWDEDEEGDFFFIEWEEDD